MYIDYIIIIAFITYGTLLCSVYYCVENEFNIEYDDFEYENEETPEENIQLNDNTYI